MPHSARIWNYWLGGKDNYEVDRAAGDAWIAVNPEITVLARASRAFLHRAVRYLAVDAGIRQFLDVGTGLPTADNTHQVAQRLVPDARVVYVDNDPLVLAHARALLSGTSGGTTRYLHADINDPEHLIAGAAGALDLTRPVALLLMNILGHLADTGHAHMVVRALVARLPAGSYVGICDGTIPTERRDADPPTAEQSAVGEHAQQIEDAQRDYAATGAVPYHYRRPEEIATFLSGLELLEPGLVPVNRWRPDRAGDLPSIGRPEPPLPEHGAVARKP